MAISSNFKELEFDFVSDPDVKKQFGSHVKTAALVLYEGISRSYNGTVTIVGDGMPSADNLASMVGKLLKVSFAVDASNDTNVKRAVRSQCFGLIGSVSYEGRVMVVDENNRSVKLNKFNISIVSPLDKLKTIVRTKNYGQVGAKSVIMTILQEDINDVADVMVTDDIYVPEKDSHEFQQTNESDYDFVKRLLIMYGYNLTLTFDQKDDSAKEARRICCTLSSSANVFYASKQENFNNEENGIAAVVPVEPSGAAKKEGYSPCLIRLASVESQENKPQLGSYSWSFADQKKQNILRQWAKSQLSHQIFTTNDENYEESLKEFKKNVDSKIEVEKLIYSFTTNSPAIRAGYEVKVSGFGSETTDILVVNSCTRVSAGILRDGKGVDESPSFNITVQAVNLDTFKRNRTSLATIDYDDFSSTLIINQKMNDSKISVNNTAIDAAINEIKAEYQQKIQMLENNFTTRLNELSIRQQQQQPIQFFEAIVSDDKADISKYAGGVFLHKNENSCIRPTRFYAVRTGADGKPEDKASALEIEVVSPTQDTSDNVLNLFPVVGQRIMVVTQGNRSFFMGYKPQKTNDEISDTTFGRRRHDHLLSNRTAFHQGSKVVHVYRSGDQKIDDLGGKTMPAEISVTDYVKTEDMLYDIFIKDPTNGIKNYCCEVDAFNNNQIASDLYEVKKGQFVTYKAKLDAIVTAQQNLAKETDSNKRKEREADLAKAREEATKASSVFTDFANELFEKKVVSGAKGETYNSASKILRLANGGTIEITSNGTARISASNIEINATKLISMYSEGKISIGAKKAVELLSGNSSVTVKPENVTLKSNMLKSGAFGIWNSSICVDSWHGVTLKGPELTGKAISTVSLSDALGARLELGSANAMLQGYEVDLHTPKAQKIVENNTKYLVSRVTDLTSFIKNKNKNESDIINSTLTKGASLFWRAYDMFQGEDSKWAKATAGHIKEIRTAKEDYDTTGDIEYPIGWVYALHIFGIITDLLDLVYDTVMDVNDLVESITTVVQEDHKDDEWDGKLLNHDGASWTEGASIADNVSLILQSIKLLSQVTLAGAMMRAVSMDAFCVSQIKLTNRKVEENSNTVSILVKKEMNAKGPAGGMELKWSQIQP
ncbi:MAG: hypothetical protein J6M93_03545 [Succinivibrio sp.]|nr:hypothetical protein [Succinivibrio sp.]